jgi:hypothetical protein
MPHILLLGAGFSRNWGGWLADEAFEYLLSCHQIDEYLRDVLWEYKPKEKGGFEGALGFLQTAYRREQTLDTDRNLMNLNSALTQMFTHMNSAFAEMGDSEFVSNENNSVGGFLAKFDAIFTLNQDLLLEYQYFKSFERFQPSKWTGWEIPGVELIPDQGRQSDRVPKWSPMQRSRIVRDESCQPYFKLHGSSDWIDPSKGWRLVVMGGNKRSAIDDSELLKWTHEQFGAYLSKPDTRLMVIGYSFGDAHINEAIAEAARGGGLRVFIIDPEGVDILKRHRAALPRTATLDDKLKDYLIGASRRTMLDIFWRDLVEHRRVMRFFGDGDMMAYPPTRN